MPQQSSSPVEADPVSSDSGAENSPTSQSRQGPKSWTSSPFEASKARESSSSAAGYSVTSPTSEQMGQLSPGVTDLVFPIRSVVSVNSSPTLTQRPNRQADYFYHNVLASDACEVWRQSAGSNASHASQSSQKESSHRQSLGRSDITPKAERPSDHEGKRAPIKPWKAECTRAEPPRFPAQLFSDIISDRSGESGNTSRTASSLTDRSFSTEPGSSAMSEQSRMEDGLVTARFKHITLEGGHAVITGRDGDMLQRCEDEPIHIPGAVQGFGLLIALQEEPGNSGLLLVKIVSENSKRIIGRSPKELFALESFTDILSDEQADNLMDHIDFIRDEDTDVAANGPEVFTISIKTPNRRSRKLWCAMHANDRNPGLLICEFELEDDPINPLVPPNDLTPELPQDTLHSQPTAEEYAESTETRSKPLRVLRSARKRKGEAAVMEVFNIMSQVQEQLTAAPNLERFLKILVGVVRELTGFHRVMIYQFDQSWNGRVVTELVDPRATKDLYKGLNFPASDIPKQARDLYKINRVRILYDRDQETARLVYRKVEDLETPLDLTHSYLRAMSPVHLRYLSNMAVRSSMSISINAFGELWGLIACHSYGSRGMRVSLPIRKMCRLVGDTSSRNIERLSFASRLQARKLINTAPTQHNPSGYIIASSDDLLKLFDADFGLLSIREETKILGDIEQTQEALAMLEYLRMRKVMSVMTSQDINQDFPDLQYAPGFSVIAGMLIVPLSVRGSDFIVFFRKGQLKEVKWAGNPYEKSIKEGTEGYLEPRKSFKIWSETVERKCREWTEEEIETAAVLCLVYGKFIEVWRQKEAALQSSQLTRLLLANSAHEVRTPLNAIINYLEIALEGNLDQETRENLTKSHSASKSLIYVINDLLDLTKTEEGGELIKGEIFDLKATLTEATDMFQGDARRKGISYEIFEHPGVPQHVIGDQRKIRQAISNITANAIQNTTKGGVKVEMYVAALQKDHVDIEVVCQDTGVGMNTKTLDSLFRDLEQVQSELSSSSMRGSSIASQSTSLTEGKEERRTLGLGLAVVARIIRNMNGQLRLKSEEGKGSRFVVQLPFELPDSDIKEAPSNVSPDGPITVQPETPQPSDGEVTLVARDLTMRDSSSGRMIHKENADSVNEKGSMRSFRSGSSNNSARSDVDRLIEAIQEPHLVEKLPKPGERSLSTRPSRPRLEKRNSNEKRQQVSLKRTLSRSFDVANQAYMPAYQREMVPGAPGEELLPFSKTPVKAIKVPDVESPVSEVPPSSSGILGRLSDTMAYTELPTSDHMHVLVAEDDPVNTRIVKKRLEKIGHEIYLTVNGEECAGAFGDKPGIFDVILMDMQMPIVDGLTSTKMIRSYEKTHPAHILSTRAALNGRVPIIAVSASLIEKDRQTYIDAGFDGWILKPISFSRLSELLVGIVDPKVREEALYQPGAWEKGGWFHKGQLNAYAARTAPSGRRPTSDHSEQAKVTAASDDPMAGEAGGEIPNEQKRLLEAQ